MSQIDFEALARFTLCQTHIFYMETLEIELELTLAKIDYLIKKETRIRDRFKKQGKSAEWVEGGGMVNLNQCMMHRQVIVDRVNSTDEHIRQLWKDHDSNLAAQ